MLLPVSTTHLLKLSIFSSPFALSPKMKTIQIAKLFLLLIAKSLVRVCVCGDSMHTVRLPQLVKGGTQMIFRFNYIYEYE